MKRSSIIYTILCLLALSIVSCDKSDDPDDNDPDMVLIATAMTDAQTFQVALYANDTLFEGYNKLYISIKEASSTDQVTDAAIVLKPLNSVIAIQSIRYRK